MTEEQIRRNETRTFTVEDSSAIQKVAYNVGSQELAIMFTNGSTTVYQDVPKGIYVNMLTAKSVGAYYNSYIVDTYESLETTPS